MKKEIRVFLTALMFYTRIPCPKWVDHSPEYLEKSSRYLPLIGVIVGLVAALVYLLSLFIFPSSIAILLSMFSTIYITGAFHEDGLSDMCDGFGGGWTKESILRIMKDSRTGTYGVVGIIFIFSLKFVSLYSIPQAQMVLVLISAHALSRFAASTLLFSHEYVRDEAVSKVKPAARMGLSSLIFGAIFGLGPLFLFNNYSIFLTLIPVFLARLYLGKLYRKRIGGITGDCAGATQQICEVVFYLSTVALWKFI